MTKIEPKQLEEYVRTYIQRYKEEYTRLTDAPPDGGGFPKMPISPYLKPQHLNCSIFSNGVIFFDKGDEPDFPWYIAGGPAIKVDYEPSVTPQWVEDQLKEHGLFGQPIGIYRIVSRTKLSREIWEGEFGTPSTTLNLVISPEENITINEYKIDLHEAVRRLTYGAFGSVVDLHLKDENAEFGEPLIIRNCGFFPADLNARTFFHYIEIHTHIGVDAWDIRNVKLRVTSDVRRDLLAMLMEPFNPAPLATVGFGDYPQLSRYNVILAHISQAIKEFELLLQTSNDSDEQVFHTFLEKTPFLIDLYGNIESKPKLEYPKNQKSPIGKSFLVPDFVVTYPDQSYKLIELEKPSKNFATQKGHPNQEFNQAAFQTGEWRHFIKNHASEIATRYPGIASKHKTAVIMSRTIQGRLKSNQELRQYIELIKETTSVDEVMTYDDLLEKSKIMFEKLLLLHSAG